MLVKDYINHYLDVSGIRHVFGVSGANIEDLYSTIAKDKKVTIVLAKNEYNAAMMAIGSYLSSKIIKPVLTTSGAGICNVIPVLAEGYSSRLPFVVISGTVPQNLEGMGAFQDTSGKGDTFDLSKVLAPCTEEVFIVNEAAEVPAAIKSAFIKAQKSKRPTVVLIPKNIFNQEVSEFFSPETMTTVKEKIVPSEKFEQIKDYISHILNNKNSSPLIVLGEELVHQKDLRNIHLFAKNLNAKIAVTPTAKGLYDHWDSDFLGLTGVMGHDEVNNHLKLTQDLILIGTQMDMLSRFSMENQFENKRVLLIHNSEHNSLYKVSGSETLELIGDIEQNIFRLYQEFGFYNDFPSPSNYHRTLDSAAQKKLDYENVIHLIEQELEDDADIFVDAGNSGAFIIHNLRVRGLGLFYVSLGMGGMGNSIGAAIGSAYHSRKPTYVFLGDGSFFMHGLEIHTALQHGLPVIYFIFNNNSHGMCSTREVIFQNGETGTNNFKPSYLGLGFDSIFPEIQSFEINSLEELRWALVKVKNPVMPCIVSINIDDNTKPPFRTFIK